MIIRYLYTDKIVVIFMVTVTSVASGNWETTTTWDTGTVPGNGDTVVISAEHTVIFDADQSTFANGLAGLTVNGTLKFITDGTVTYLKMAGNISGTGDFYCGTEDTPIPAPTTSEPVVATICFNGNYRFTLTGDLVFYGEMREGYTTTATEAGSTDTTITLTDDLNLRAGDVVYISHPTTGVNATKHTIQDYDSNTKVVTFTSQLGRVVSSGAGVTLDSRNIQCMNLNKTVGSMLVNGKNNGLAVGVRFYNFAIGPIYQCNNWLIKHCTGNNNVSGGITYQGYGHIFTDCIGNNNTLGGISHYGSGHIFTNCIGNNNSNGGISHYGSENVLIDCHKGEGNGGNITCHDPQDFTSYNSELELISTTPVGNQVFHQFQSYDHNQVEGNYCSWMYGGTIETLLVEGVVQPGKLIFKPISNSAPVFRDYPILAPANRLIHEVVMVNKDFSGGSVKLQFIDPRQDPLINSSYSPLTESTLPDIPNTDLQLGISYKSPVNKEVILRVLVMNGSGSASIDVSRVERTLARKRNLVFK